MSFLQMRSLLARPINASTSSLQSPIEGRPQFVEGVGPTRRRATPPAGKGEGILQFLPASQQNPPASPSVVQATDATPAKRPNIGYAQPATNAPAPAPIVQAGAARTDVGGDDVLGMPFRSFVAMVLQAARTSCAQWSRRDQITQLDAIRRAWATAYQAEYGRYPMGQNRFSADGALARVTAFCAANPAGDASLPRVGILEPAQPFQPAGEPAVPHEAQWLARMGMAPAQFLGLDMGMQQAWVRGVLGHAGAMMDEAQVPVIARAIAAYSMVLVHPVTI